MGEIYWMLRVAVALILLVVVLPAVALAQVEKRIALLIGNQTYTAEIGVLANAHNDVVLLERTLKGLASRWRPYATPTSPPLRVPSTDMLVGWPPQGKMRSASFTIRGTVPPTAQPTI